jgi:hypothetical protein
VYQNKSQVPELSRHKSSDSRQTTSRPTCPLTESDPVVIAPRDDAPGRGARAALRAEPVCERSSRLGRNLRRDGCRGMRFWLQRCEDRPRKVPPQALPSSADAWHYLLRPDSCDLEVGILPGFGEGSDSAASPNCLVIADTPNPDRLASTRLAGNPDRQARPARYRSAVRDRLRRSTSLAGHRWHSQNGVWRSEREVHRKISGVSLIGQRYLIDIFRAGR